MENIEQAVYELEVRSKNNTQRLDKLEQTITALNDMAISVKVMATKMETLVGQVDKLDVKVSDLEAKPGKRYEGLVEKIIWAVTGAVVAWILTRIGL